MRANHASRLINRFALAVEEHAFIGTIPVRGQDDEEQAAIDAARSSIIKELEVSRQMLMAKLTS